jgi:hypothetical protein
MGFLDIFALFVHILIIGLVGFLFWMLAGLPGRVAKENNHPFSDAIAIGGWTTLVLGAVAWPFVLMWAYAPGLIDRSDPEKRIAELEKELVAVRNAGVAE